MKKWLFALTACMLLFALFTGCAAKSSTSPKDTVTIDQPQQNSSEKGGGQGITVNKITYTLVDDPQKLPDELKGLLEQPGDQELTKVVQGEGTVQYVFITLGQRSTGGYDIQIQSVEDVEGRVSVVYSEVKPGKNDMVTQVITYPAKVLKIDSPLPVDVRKAP